MYTNLSLLLPHSCLLWQVLGVYSEFQKVHPLVVHLWECGGV